MGKWTRQIAFIVAAWAAANLTSRAQDTGAISNGIWEDPTIWTAGTVPGSSNNVYIGSTYPSGAAATATVTLTQAEDANNVYLGNGSGTNGTLNVVGNSLVVLGSLYVGVGGGVGTIQESGGALDAVSAYVYNGNSLTLGTFDGVGYLQLNNGSTARTTTSGNIGGAIDVFTGSTLNLGNSINTGYSSGNYLNVQDSGSVLDMNGHSVTTGAIEFGWNGSSAVTIQNQGTIATQSFFLGNGMIYSFLSTDSVGIANVSGATLTTAATGNITADASVFLGGTLNLGANLNLIGGGLVVDLGGTVDAHGHGITVSFLSVGSAGTASLLNAGPVQVTDLDIGSGSTLTLHGGDVVNTQMLLTGGSVLDVQETNGTGLTLNGTLLSSLTIDPSQMNLIFDANSGWDFRWADPTGGNWIGTIDGMIASGQIEITNGSGYQVYDSGGYTYVGFQSASVPEPSSLVLAVLASVGIASGIMRRRGSS